MYFGGIHKESLLHLISTIFVNFFPTIFESEVTLIVNINRQVNSQKLHWKMVFQYYDI